jgi:DNA repair protein RecN (Recombination protein N)
MLTYLRIKDFALIESLELEMGPGLAVMTGETGAGKSIILAAVGLLLGQRASADLIRAGADAALVEAQFMVDPQGPMAARLADEGLDAGEELVVRRVVSREGRNRVQVNGSLANLSLLGELGPALLALCGQHSQQDLLRPEEHLLLLDAYASLEERREEVGRVVRQVQALDKELDQLRQDLARREERRHWLQAVVQELDEAEIDPEEEAALRAERKLLANAEQVAQLAQGALSGLVEAEDGSAVALASRVRGLLDDLARLDERAGDLARRMEELFYQLDDVAGELRDYVSRLVFDPGRLDWVEARLMSLQRITRKYGGDAPSALQALAEARQELAGLDQGDQRLASLQEERGAALEQALKQAKALSKARRKAAPALAKAAQAELKDLGLAQCQLKVELAQPTGHTVDTADGPLGARGLEAAEFFIAPNPGEGFRPLRRIASGGELSRMLLALKGLVAQKKGAPTQVFDEVDAGIGGATGAAVGQKLAALAESAQVLVITHLPQIAAFGDRHYTVRKETQKGRTATALASLDETGRAGELARMLSGSGGEDTALNHAKELLASASALKKAP